MANTIQLAAIARATGSMGKVTHHRVNLVAGL
jgi:hypothetical protein